MYLPKIEKTSRKNVCTFLRLRKLVGKKVCTFLRLRKLAGKMYVPS